MKLAIFLRELGQPVAYYPKLAQVTGGVLANLFLCQMYYWQGRQSDPAGWIYKTQAEIETETGLSRYEQETARKLLRQRSLLKERYKGLPRRLEFWLDEDELENRWAFFLEYQVEKPFVTETKPNKSNRHSNSKRKQSTSQTGVSPNQPQPLETSLHKDSSIMLDDHIIECGLTTNNTVVTPHTSLLEQHKQYCGNPTFKPAVIQHPSLLQSNMQVCGITTGNLYTENTPENTPETTPEINLPPIPPQGGSESVGKENLAFPQPEEPRTGIQPPEDEFCNQVDSPRLGYLSAPVEKHVVKGCPLDYETLLPYLANLSNQPDSQLQPLTHHEERYSVASLIGNKAMNSESVGNHQLQSLIGNKAMELGTVGKNQLERATQIAFRQNFDPARSQTDEAMSARATRESSAGNEYSSPAATETKIAATQTHLPAVLSHQPELSRVEANNFGPDEHDAVLPTRKIAAIETSPPVPNPSQHQAPARLQTELSFHPRSVANRVQETRFDRNQADLTKNLDGSDRLPWDTGKRGVFDQAFENHMARSLMQYPAYRDLMAGELITKVRKHISAGRYDLKRRDELLIEWEAMQNHAHNDFSTASSTLTAKGAARRAKIARALNMKDFS